MNLQPTIKYKKVKSAEEQWTALYCRLSCDDDLDGDTGIRSDTDSEYIHGKGLRYAYYL